MSLQRRFKKSLPSLAPTTTSKISGIHGEQHYPPSYWAKKWGLSDDFIRQLFINEAGVIKIARPETLKKRGYVTLRIPESVAVRVHERLHGRVA